MTIGHHGRRTFLFGGAAGLLAPALGPGPAGAQDRDRPAEGGIGGTGIVGVLTEFGSLVVGGLRVTTDAGTRVSDGFGPLPEAALRVGDALTVEASGAPGPLVARRVHVTHPLVGTVAAVEAAGRRLTVNGVRVDLAAPVRGVVAGDRVAVSGLWRGDRVVASALSPARAADDLVSGDATGRGADRRVGGVRVTGRGTGGLTPLGFATVIGRFDPGTGVLTARAARAGRFTGAAGPLRRLAVEGYLAPSREAPFFRVSGLGHSFRRGLDLAQFAGDRVLFRGAYTGRFAPRTALVLPEGTAARTALLGRLSRDADAP